MANQCEAGVSLSYSHDSRSREPIMFNEKKGGNTQMTIQKEIDITWTTANSLGCEVSQTRKYSEQID